MSISIKFCTPFLANPWPSLKMCHPWHFQGPTGLEANQGPRRPSHQVQSIKIDKKLNLVSKYTQHRPPQRIYDFWPSLKMCHLCHFQGPTGLEATRGPGGPAQPLRSMSRMTHFKTRPKIIDPLGGLCWVYFDSKIQF